MRGKEHEIGVHPAILAAREAKELKCYSVNLSAWLISLAALLVVGLVVIGLVWGLLRIVEMAASQ